MTYTEALAEINAWIVANGNQEITADVLRPVLISMLEASQDTTGELTDLATTDQSNLVAAINELKGILDTVNTNAGVQIYYGTDDPNIVPPSVFKAGDFYLQTDVSNNPVQLWQNNGFEWVQVNSGNGIPDAPSDGTTYGRKDGEWVEVGGGTSGVETVNGESPDGGGNVVVNRQSVYDQGNDYETSYDSSVLAGSGYSDASYFNIPSLGDGSGLFYDYSVILATEDDGTIHSISDTKTLQSGQAYIGNEIFKTNPDGSGESTTVSVISPDSGSQGVYIEAEQTDTSSLMVGITNLNVLTNKQETIITRPPDSGNPTKVTYQTPETIEPGVEATITKAAPEVAGDYFEPIIFEVGGTDYTADATGRVVLPSGGGGGGVTEVTGTDGVTIASGTTTPVVGLGNITPDSVAATGTVSGSNLSGTNTGDQTSISGITGTKAQFDTAVTDGNFLYVGDVTQYTDANARAAVVQNSMTASTTLSPSVTAVNTALAGKRDAPIFLQLTSDYTGLTGTSAQKIFNVGASGNGRVSLEAKTYRIRGQIIVDGVSAPSGSMTFSLGGTATFTSSFSVNGKKAAETASAPLQAYAINATSVQITTSNSNTTGFFDVEGTVVVTGAGYLQPLIAHSVGVSGGFTIKAKSWFEAELISDNSTTHSANAD